jgi:hypothetical protein
MELSREGMSPQEGLASRSGRDEGADQGMESVRDEDVPSPS